MFHKKRIWTVTNILSEEELADKVINFTWCTCNGFRLKGYLFLNDSTGPEGVQEYGIVKEDSRALIESISFGWCDYYRALMYICQIVDGRYDNMPHGVLPQDRIDRSPNHRCSACA